MSRKNRITCIFLKKVIALAGGFLLSASLSGQNITDLSVIEDKSADRVDLLNIGTTPAIQDSVFLHPERIRYNHRCFQLEGKDTFIFSGTFHYFRVPQPLWADRFRKLKKAGFNCVETYIPWNWHERTMPRSVDDESQIDLRELDDFLKMAEEFGLYTPASAASMTAVLSTCPGTKMTLKSISPCSRAISFTVL